MPELIKNEQFENMIVYTVVLYMQKSGKPAKINGWTAPWISEDGTNKAIKRLLKEGWIIQEDSNLYEAKENTTERTCDTEQKVTTTGQS